MLKDFPYNKTEYMKNSASLTKDHWDLGVCNHQAQSNNTDCTSSEYPHTYVWEKNMKFYLFFNIKNEM